VIAGRTPPPTRATVEGRAYLELRAIARKAGRASDEYLRLYALEGFLLRLAASDNSEDFVLKGGVLLAAYQLRRPTADIDFAALNTSNDVETMKFRIVGVADTQLPKDQDDGLAWIRGPGRVVSRVDHVKVPSGSGESGVSTSCFTRPEKALIVKLPDAWLKATAVFDDDNLVSFRGARSGDGARGAGWAVRADR
jgi:hypothetical protein